MKKLFSFIAVICLVLYVTCPAFAWPVGSSWGEEDLAVSGDLQFQSTIFASGHNSGATQRSSDASHLDAAALAFGLIQFSNGDQRPRQIANGSPGQMITLELLADPNIVIAEDRAGDDEITKTGWTSVTFDSVYDSITFLWLDNTTGWIITANNGCTIGR